MSTVTGISSRVGPCSLSAGLGCLPPACRHSSPSSRLPGQPPLQGNERAQVEQLRRGGVRPLVPKAPLLISQSSSAGCWEHEALDQTSPWCTPHPHLGVARGLIRGLPLLPHFHSRLRDQLLPRFHRGRLCRRLVACRRARGVRAKERVRGVDSGP